MKVLQSIIRTVNSAKNADIIFLNGFAVRVDMAIKVTFDFACISDNQIMLVLWNCFL